MKKAFVTGHTSGIGKGIYDALVDRGWNVTGFSKSTGWDINDIEQVKTLAAQAQLENVDLFINNVYHPWHQSEMLYHLFRYWRNNADKTIINISSNAGSVATKQREPNMYAVAKNALNNLCIQFQFMTSYCKIIDIKCGPVDTARIAHRADVKKLEIDDVTYKILWIIDQPDDIYVKSISFIKK